MQTTCTITLSFLRVTNVKFSIRVGIDVQYLIHRPHYNLAHRREAPTSVRCQFLQRDRGGNRLLLLPNHTPTFFFSCNVCQISRGGQIVLDICTRSTGDVRRGANA